MIYEVGQRFLWQSSGIRRIEEIVEITPHNIRVKIIQTWGGDFVSVGQSYTEQRPLSDNFTFLKGQEAPVL